MLHQPLLKLLQNLREVRRIVDRFLLSQKHINRSRTRLSAKSSSNCRWQAYLADPRQSRTERSQL